MMQRNDFIMQRRDLKGKRNDRNSSQLLHSHSPWPVCMLTRALLLEQNITQTINLQGLDAERDVLRESQRLASERDRELESLRQQVIFTYKQFWQNKKYSLRSQG